MSHSLRHKNLTKVRPTANWDKFFLFWKKETFFNRSHWNYLQIASFPGGIFTMSASYHGHIPVCQFTMIAMTSLTFPVFGHWNFSANLKTSSEHGALPPNFGKLDTPFYLYVLKDFVWIINRRKAIEFI